MQMNAFLIMQKIKTTAEASKFTIRIIMEGKIFTLSDNHELEITRMSMPHVGRAKLWILNILHVL